MILSEILLLIGISLLLRVLAAFPYPELRGWLIFAASVVLLYWLQPVMPIRGLDFWLPTVTLALAALGWLLTAPAVTRTSGQNALAAGALVALVLLVALTRYLGAGDWLVSTRPPPFLTVLAGLALLVGLTGSLALVFRGRVIPGSLLSAAVVLLIALLVVLKTPALSLEAGSSLRVVMGQNPELAGISDIRWLGFSYICFRLIHTLRDRQTRRLAPADLKTYLSYMVFFPAVIAGPIDRLERFAKDYRAADAPVPDQAAVAEKARPAGALGIVAQIPPDRFSWPDAALGGDLTESARRLALGLFKKFAIADSLALIALNAANAPQAQETGWLWLMVYLYAFQIYYDFSGYTDIAIGLGRILGIRLPENFNSPYLKPNLTQFWNAWHMSLTQWFRAYFFNPFVRWLRLPQRKVSPVMVLLLSQVFTMLLIGFWHGITVNFAIWGLWHGLGLFVQNRWTEWARPRFAARSLSPPVQRGLAAASLLLTFHYVALGWVWFALPRTDEAVAVILRLFGMGY